MSVPADLRSITEVAPLVRSGALSPVTLIEGCLARIEARRELNAFITLLADGALEAARTAARDVSAGRYLGPLHGIPVSLKDLIDVAGTPTTAGSNVPSRHPVADAPVVERLRRAGAIVIGKTNLHEFAFGTTSEESAFGPVRHPRDASRSAGGSSSGAAVALVEGMCFGSVGTDTGGSIRIPSAACGTVGLKPTYGELPCDGIVPLSTTLDHVGPMTRTVGDAALMFAAMQGGAAHDDAAPRRLTFGAPEAYFYERIDPEVSRALDRARSALRETGHHVRTVTIEHAAWTPDVYLHIVLAESAQYHAPMLEAHAAGYSPGVRARLEMGRYVLAEDYVRALRLREVLRRSVEAALHGCDALLLPALPIAAPPLGAATVDVAGVAEPVRAVMLRLTQLFNISGNPAIAMPAGVDSAGFPLSLQLVGQHGRTGRLLSVAAAVESVLDRNAAASP